MNYAQLTQAIQDYTENTETSFVNNIPVFVQIAEKRIYNTVQVLAERKATTGVLTLGNQYYALPADWLSTFSFAITVNGGQQYLLNKDVEFIREAFPDPAAAGTPTHYALYNPTTALIGPTPDAAYAVDLQYYGYPTSIVTAGTTWLGTNFEDVLLYGSLREAYLYMKGEADITASYEQKYQEGLMLLKMLAEGKNRQDMYRTKQNRVPVQ